MRIHSVSLLNVSRRLIIFGGLLALFYLIFTYTKTPSSASGGDDPKKDKDNFPITNVETKSLHDIRDSARNCENSEVDTDKKAQSRTEVKKKLIVQTRALDFIPRHFTDCRDMFPGTSATNFLPQLVTETLDELNARVKELGGMKEGYSAERREQALMAVKLASLPFIETVCETGFNGGHSSVFWLAMNPKATVYSFDIGWHSYSKPMAEFIAAKFPGRFHIVWGASERTLPEFRKAHPDVACDLVVIDGGHSEAGALSDFNNFREMASCHNILFFDNWPEPHTFTWHPIGKVWEEKKRIGELAEIFKCGNPTGKEDFVGFSVGRIVVENC